METNVSRIVVIGSRGFVGSSLLNGLSKNGLNKQSIEIRGVPSSEVDLTQSPSQTVLKNILKDDDTVVFVSALTPDKGRDFATLGQNINMLINFEKAIEEINLSHLVYISSDAVYDDSAALINEATPCGPNSFHGAMHVAREIQLRNLSKSKNFKLAILRPTAIYGKGDTHRGYGPNLFVQNVKEQKLITLFGNGEEKRDHLHIQDFVKVICHTIFNQHDGVLNVASGATQSFRRVAEQVLAITKTGQITPTPRKNPITHRGFDLTKLYTVYPSFHAISLNDGLKNMLG